MKVTATVAVLLSAAGVAQAQGVTSAIAPTASAPAGCTSSYDGTFEITVAKVEGAQKRDAPVAVSFDPKPLPSRKNASITSPVSHCPSLLPYHHKLRLPWVEGTVFLLCLDPKAVGRCPQKAQLRPDASTIQW